jgi:alpha-mannosidase
LVTLPEHTIIETIKQAEDGNGIIVRFYECNRQRGHVTLTTNFPLSQAFITNLLEDNQAELALDNAHQMTLTVKPFQIVTVRLIPQ